MENRAHARACAVKLGVIALAASGLIWGGQAQAANVIWSGDGDDGLFETLDNWVGGNPPQNNDYSDTAVFGASATAGEVILSTNRTIKGISFETVGWTLGEAGRQLTLKTVNSSGSGVNTVSLRIKTAQGNFTWTIDGGNTVNLDGGLIHDGSGRSLRLVGGGTLDVAGPLSTAWSSAVNSFYLEEGRLIVHDSIPYRYEGSANNSVLYIDGEGAVLQLQTTVAAAQGIIGTRIQDQTGLGLSVTDIGGGFVEIAVVPEPAMLGLASLSGLLMMRRRN